MTTQKYPYAGFEDLSLVEMLSVTITCASSYPAGSPEQTLVIGQHLTPIMHKQHAELMAIPVAELGAVAERINT